MSYHYVVVTNEVGKVIKLYMELPDSYADMDLSEFLAKTLGREYNKTKQIT